MQRTNKLWLGLILTLLVGCASGKPATPDGGPAPNDGLHNETISFRDADPGADLDKALPDTQPAHTIVVTAPAGGESWPAGSTQTISWTSTGPGDPVDIVLYKGGIKHADIVKGRTDSGTHNWAIPSTTPAGSDYTVRVNDASNPTIHGESPAPFSIVGWQYRVAVSIDASKAVAALTDYQVLVALDAAAGFAYAHADPTGADLRFASSMAPGGTFDLPHWIESWTPAGKSLVWVKVPSIPAGKITQIYLFYGKPGAASTSDKALTFPKQHISSGNQTLGGVQAFDWFELKKGHTLTLTGGQLLAITARKIIIAGAISGAGKGYVGGTSSGKGAGTGGGGGASVAGGGGGGYGNSGGLGGYDSADTPGAKGAPYGSMVSKGTEMGSGGGAGNSQAGGAGGGGVSIVGYDVRINGASITMDGSSGAGGAQSGGGGSGGGILIQGYQVAVSGTLSVKGGLGGSGSSSANDGGGGGAGGRVKIFHEAGLTNTTSVATSGGAGGKYGGASYGAAGGTGTSHISQTGFNGVTVKLGPETPL
jgi:Domain of unknown function (DUF2341)/Kre9/KNH-like N-terminal Ig-like domain